MSRGGKWWSKWLESLNLALTGLGLAARTKRFWVVFVPVFLVFGTLLTLLSGGTAAFSLFFATDFSGKLKILLDGLLGLFGVGQYFADWLGIFVVTLIQATLIGAIAIAWRRNKDQASLQSSGIAAGLAILGSGCPTCGTALITPILATIFSTGGYAIATTVSSIIMLISVIVALGALYKVGKGLNGCKLKLVKEEM